MKIILCQWPCGAQQALAFWRPAAQGCHVGLGPVRLLSRTNGVHRLTINEYEAGRGDPVLIPLPARASAAYIRAGLFLGEFGLFSNEYPVRCTKDQTVR